MTSGETVLITGVTRGLGRHLTEILCSQGVRVIGIARNCDELLKMENSYSGFSFLCADLSDINEVDRLLLQVVSLPKLSATILNAAVYDKKIYANKTAYLMNVNYHSQVSIVNELIKAQRCDRFVLVSSIMAKLPDTSFPVYGESKSLITDFIIGLRSGNMISGKSHIAYLGPVVNKYQHPFERVYKSLYTDTARYIVENIQSSRGDFYYPVIWQSFIGMMKFLPFKAVKAIMKAIR